MKTVLGPNHRRVHRFVLFNWSSCIIYEHKSTDNCHVIQESQDFTVADHFVIS